MNYIKKLLYVGIFICMLSFVVSAADENTYSYEYPAQNLTVEFAEDTTLSPNIRQTIADSIAYNTPVPQTYSLCWLLGHDYYIHTVSATYHEKSEYDPRCLLEIYDVKKCNNCDYANPTLVTSRYISCCPPEASAISLDD